MTMATKTRLKYIIIGALIGLATWATAYTSVIVIMSLQSQNILIFLLWPLELMVLGAVCGFAIYTMKA